jgi:hypothetical protein
MDHKIHKSLETRSAVIKFRIDVDYPYPSRIRSFIFTTIGAKIGKDYMKNSKITAKMINETTKEVKTTWFFTPTTIPDKELLNLLNNDKHEVALHIVNNPYSEWKNLEKITGASLRYYTVHGTERLLARIMWRRWTKKTLKIPQDFPLISFYHFPTEHLDKTCYSNSPKHALQIAQNAIKEGKVLHFHPIWLFQRGKINYRGPVYETLRSILEVDNELRAIEFRKKNLLKIARDATEYERDVIPTRRLTEKLEERGVDIFTFLERRWCHTFQNSKSWIRGKDNIALLHLTNYDDWWKNIGKKTRNMVRKAERSGVRTEIAEPNEGLAEGIWKIYHETPIRQERAFPHYGAPLQAVIDGLSSTRNAIYIGAYLQNELVGFIQLINGDRIGIISQMLSLQKHWDKAINNALIAKAAEVCANNHVKSVMYGRMGNHPTLDNFKQSNGFCPFQLTRYYIPLTRKGKIAIKLGLHRELKDALPQAVKYPLIPLYNWISRTRMKLKLRLAR